eukprot:m.74399 g.74399  ORF g.74399 m.74399 type:complete len:295 (-) comp11801_c1_seq1:1363-2247(-)
MWKKRNKQDVFSVDESVLENAPFNKRGIVELLDAINTLKDGDRDVIDVFFKLPSKKELPEYYEVISSPIDMASIYKKTRKSSSYKTYLDVYRDLMLMVKNAQTFNRPNSQVYKDAKRLELLISEKFSVVSDSLLSATLASTSSTSTTEVLLWSLLVDMKQNVLWRNCNISGKPRQFLIADTAKNKMEKKEFIATPFLNKFFFNVLRESTVHAIFLVDILVCADGDVIRVAVGTMHSNSTGWLFFFSLFFIILHLFVLFLGVTMVFNMYWFTSVLLQCRIDDFFIGKRAIALFLV